MKYNLINLMYDIKSATEHNCHTEALMYLATALDDNDSISALAVIDEEHNTAGYLTSVMTDFRNLIRANLLDAAKKLMPEHDYEMIYQSF